MFVFTLVENSKFYCVEFERNQPAAPRVLRLVRHRVAKFRTVGTAILTRNFQYFCLYFQHYCTY